MTLVWDNTGIPNKSYSSLRTTTTTTTTAIIFIFFHFKIYMLFGLRIASANLGGLFMNITGCYHEQLPDCCSNVSTENV